MYRLEELKCREIARRLGISESAVEKHIAKAMFSANGRRAGMSPASVPPSDQILAEAAAWLVRLQSEARSAADVAAFQAWAAAVLPWHSRRSAGPGILPAAFRATCAARTDPSGEQAPCAGRAGGLHRVGGIVIWEWQVRIKPSWRAETYHAQDAAGFSSIPIARGRGFRQTALGRMQYGRANFRPVAPGVPSSSTLHQQDRGRGIGAGHRAGRRTGFVWSFKAPRKFSGRIFRQ